MADEPLENGYACSPPHGRWLLAFGLMLLAVHVGLGCGSNVGPGETVVDTLPNGVVRVYNPMPPHSAAESGVAGEIFRVGEADGNGHAVFGRINGLLLGPTGNLYVLDGYASEIRVFDSAGAYVRTFGGPGSGPGEFQDARGLTWGPNGTLWAMDQAAQRYTAFTPEGQLLDTFRRRVAAFGTYWRGTFGAGGTLYEPTALADPHSPGGRSALIAHSMQPDGPAPVDTFPLPKDVSADFFVSFPGGTLKLPIPFAAQPQWALDKHGLLWVGDGRTYQIAKRTMAGDTTRLFVLDRQLDQLSAGERTEIEQETRSRLAALGADPDQVDLTRIPDTKPAYGRLFVDNRGLLWVAIAGGLTQQNERAGGAFDIFSSDGKYLTSVRFAVSPNRPLAFGGNRVAGVTVDSVGTPMVIVYWVHLPAVDVK